MSRCRKFRRYQLRIRDGEQSPLTIKIATLPDPVNSLFGAISLIMTLVIQLDVRGDVLRYSYAVVAVLAKWCAPDILGHICHASYLHSGA